MSRGRENNYDLLRIICTIMVVSLHVSGAYIYEITSRISFGDFFHKDIIIACAFNVIPRFAVPCFLMISGAFILSAEENINYKFFYHKSMKNIGIHIIVFSFIYFVYSVLVEINKNTKGNIILALARPIRAWFRGEPFYHMWYCYMLIGIYLMAPFIIIIKNTIGEIYFKKIVWIFVTCACFSVWTSTYSLNWDIGLSFCYLGYFMLGYVLRNWANNNKSNIKGTIFIILGTIVELIITYFRYVQALEGIADTDLKFELVTPYNPMVLAASIFIFLGFSLIKLDKSLSKLSSISFYIYLIHAGIWDLLKVSVKNIIGINGNFIVFIPLSVITVLLISIILALVYKKIWKIIDEKFKISNRICRLFKV